MKSPVAAAFDVPDKVEEHPPHKFFLEVLLPQIAIDSSDKEDIVGARTVHDIVWKGPVGIGHTMILCHEGIELDIQKIMHWPWVLTTFSEDEFTSLHFVATREQIDTLLKNTGFDTEIWVPVTGFEKKRS